MRIEKILIFGLGLWASQAMGMDYLTNDAVLIKSLVSNGNTGFCSGVLISRRRLLTAAHCLDQNSNFQIKVSLPAATGEVWMNAMNPVKDPRYNVNISKYNYDVGTLDLQTPLPLNSGIHFKPLCRFAHLHEVAERVGYGGRQNQNLKTIIPLTLSKVAPTRLSLIAIDPESVPGDSGGPIYATEYGHACLLATHSTLQTGPGMPPESYNSFLIRLMHDFRNE